MHEVLVNRLGGLSLPRKSVVRLTDRPDMTLNVYRGRKTTTQQKMLVQATLYIILRIQKLEGSLAQGLEIFGSSHKFSGYTFFSSLR